MRFNGRPSPPHPGLTLFGFRPSLLRKRPDFFEEPSGPVPILLEAGRSGAPRVPPAPPGFAGNNVGRTIGFRMSEHTFLMTAAAVRIAHPSRAPASSRWIHRDSGIADMARNGPVALYTCPPDNRAGRLQAWLKGRRHDKRPPPRPRPGLDRRSHRLQPKSGTLSASDRVVNADRSPPRPFAFSLARLPNGRPCTRRPGASA